MAYSEESIADMERDVEVAKLNLDELLVECIRQSERQASEQAKEYLTHGAGRRLQIIIRSLDNLFRLFPLRTVEKLPKDVLSDIQINLHAFFINLYAVFDNLAWAFVLRHGIEQQIGGHTRIGLFHRATDIYFSAELKTYLRSPEMTRWRDEYLKTYRDALAHRIPLYVPPFVFTNDEAAQLQELFEEQGEKIRTHDFNAANRIKAEMDMIGQPAFVFVPAISRLAAERPVYLHPQLICDSQTVIECGRQFFEHWDVCRALAP